jgi:redox-sensitive bicupin YhaK (pirin superfamily)
LRGSLQIDGTHVPESSLALLGRGDVVSVTTREPAGFMLLAGEPLREPIAHHGPFVMNTRAEIEQAILDYQQGLMGRLE